MGAKTHAGLVEQQDPRLRHEAPGHREHLLLTSGERTRQLSDALLQNRKHRQNPLFRGFDFFLVVAQEGTHVQVFLHGEPTENPPPFRHLHDASRDHMMRCNITQGLPIESHFALGRWQDPTDCFERSALSGTVCADQGDDLVAVHLQREPPQRMNVAVEDM